MASPLHPAAPLAPPKELPNNPPAPPPNDAIIALVINACVAIWINDLIARFTPEEENIPTSHL